MSEIRETVKSESPETSTDEGQTAAQAEVVAAPQAETVAAPPVDTVAPPQKKTARGRSDSPDEDDNVGNVIRRGSDDDEDDSIGNRIDGPAPVRSGNAEAGPKPRPKQPGKQGDKGDRGPRPHADPARTSFHVGDKVRAKIVSISPAAVFVDLWGKDKAVLDIRELAMGTPVEARQGEGVDVIVIQDGARGGNLVVTRDPARAERGREMIVQAFNNTEIIEGLITGVNRGGLEVDINGIRAFCPSSQLELAFPPTFNPKTLVLTRQQFKIHSLVDGGREAVVSRRAVLEDVARSKATEALANIKVGATVKGIVTSIRDYVVLVDLGGVEGQIHKSHLTNNRSARPGDIVKVGDEVEAKVLRISNPEQEKDGADGPEAVVSDEIAPTDKPVEKAAAEKAAAENPGDKKGDKKGKDNKDNKRKRPGLKPDGIPRVHLSRRVLEADPWDVVDKQFPVGTLHRGKVARMQAFGAFVELSAGIDGLLHVSELGDGRRIEHPSEVLKEGQMLTVRVERVERGNRRIALSLLPDDVTEEQLKKAVNPRVGMITKVKVIGHDAGNVMVQMEGAVGKSARGIIAPPDSGQPRGADLRKAIPLGLEIVVKVVEVERGRPRFSVRAAVQDEERQAYRAYQREANSKSVGVSLADKLRAQLAELPSDGSSGRK